MTIAQRIQTGLAVPARRQYAPAVQRFNAWHKGGPITDDTIRAFFAAQKLAGRYSPRTMRVTKVAIKAAWKESAPANIRNDVRFASAVDTLFRSIKTATPDQSTSESDICSKQELEQIIAACSEKVGLFTRALYNSCSRISELLSVKLDKCKLKRGIYYCKIEGKGGRERDLMLDQATFEEVRRVFGGRTFLFEHHGKKYSPQFMGRQMKAAAVRSLGEEGKHFHPHVLRHSRITHLREAGYPLEAVMSLSGHTRADTLMRIYSHTKMKPDEIIKTGLTVRNAMTAALEKAEIQKQVSLLQKRLEELNRYEEKSHRPATSAAS